MRFNNVHKIYFKYLYNVQHVPAGDHWLDQDEFFYRHA